MRSHQGAELRVAEGGGFDYFLSEHNDLYADSLKKHCKLVVFLSVIEMTVVFRTKREF